MREDKLKEMQAVLRKHGYSFEPEEWASPQTGSPSGAASYIVKIGPAMSQHQRLQ